MGKGARGNKAEPPPPFFYRLISVELSRDFIPDFTKHNEKKKTPKNPLDQKSSFSRLTSVYLGSAVSLLRITKQKTRQKERQLRLKAASTRKRCSILTAHVFLSGLV